MEKRMEDLNLEDDFLFSRVMCDEEICRCVLEKILNISIRRTLFQKANPIPACAEATLFLSVHLTLLQKAGISTPFRTPVSKAPGFSWEMRQRNCF
ncbi:putative uncharacterized protein [Hungatella hathewayi CAG:224]|nr:putative uncharacterized protein [Hungatella hathewayi CAG:224]